MLNAGAELVDIKALLGHESIATPQLCASVGWERMERVVVRCHHSTLSKRNDNFLHVSCTYPNHADQADSRRKSLRLSRLSRLIHRPVRPYHGNKSTLQSPKYTYANAQTFFVKLKASVENGCTDSAVKSINISPLPTTCDFNFARTYNVNSKSFTFTPIGGSMSGINYTWLMGDGNKVKTTGVGTVYTYDNTIKYCVTMIASNQADCECSVIKCLDAFTSTQDISLSDYSIYPNPSNGVFNIRSKSTNNPITVEIYNVLGEVINTFSFDNSTEASIDLSANNNGMYIIKILDGNQVFTGKVNILK